METPMSSSTGAPQQKKLLNKKLDFIRTLGKRHFQKFITLKRGCLVAKTIISILNTVSVTSAIMLYADSPVAIAMCTASSTSAMIGTVTLQALSLEEKYHSHQTTYLNCKAILDQYETDLLRSNLTSTDLHRMLTSVNEKLLIVLDGSEPVPAELSGTV
jgi:hypothetical protein